MFALCATILCFLAVSQSAPLSCDDLVSPMDLLEQHHLQGRWALVAGSLSHPASLEALALRESITVSLSNLSQTTVSYTQINRFNHQCQYLPYNISVGNSSFTFDVGGRFKLTGALLYTSCPDCLVIRWDVESKRRVSLDVYLISRRREVGVREMEEYRAQLKCLGLPPPVVMDPMKELCPDQTPTELPAAQTGEEAEGQWHSISGHI